MFLSTVKFPELKKGRYVVFANNAHDSVGGMHDAIGASDDLPECAAIFEKSGLDYGHVFDTSEFIVIKLVD